MSNETSKPEQIMTRDKFIRKWLGVISEYSETNRDRMRDDLDKVIESVQPQPTEAREFNELAAIILKFNDSGETSPTRLARLIHEYYSPIIASQQSEIERLKTELANECLAFNKWCTDNEWNLCIGMYYCTSSLTSIAKTPTELYTLYQSQKQKP